MASIEVISLKTRNKEREREREGERASASVAGLANPEAFEIQ